MAKWSLLGLGAVARAAAFFALWLLLVDATDEPNLLTGAACALGAAALATAVQSLRSVHARLRPSMLRYVYRPFVLLVSDTLRVIWALLQRLVLRRPVSGMFRAAQFRATGDSEDDAARRILTQWGASLAANRYAIGIDRRTDLLIVHQLVDASGPLDPLELG